MADEYDGTFESGDEEAIESFLVEGRWEEFQESDEEKASPRYRRGRGKLPLRQRGYSPSPGVTGANIQTPAGRAQVQFGKPLASQEALDKLAREVKSEITGLVASVKKVDESLDKNTGVLDKKVNTLNSDFKKTQQQSSMMMLLPMLLTKPPVLTRITTISQTTPSVTESFDIPENAAVYKKEDSTMLLLMMMMMFGGFGGGTGDSMTMMMMVLALSGGFK